MDNVLAFIFSMVAYNPMPVVNNACDYIKTDWFVCMNEDNHDYTIKKETDEFNKRISDCKLIEYKFDEGKHKCTYEHPDGTRSLFFLDNKNCSYTKKCLGK
jgi:hypothetical protein